MLSILIFSPVIFLVVSFSLLWFLVKKGFNKKFVYIAQFCSFVGVSVLALVSIANKVVMAAESSSDVVSSGKAMPFAIGLIASSLALGLAAIAAGIALSSAIPAAIAAMSENEKTFGKSMVFAIFGEAIVLYGFIISFLILNNLKLLVGGA